MPRTKIPLDDVRVATPCPASWDAMTGNERVRFCGQCSLNVYNLSGMRRAEAEQLIASTEGRLCVRYFRRKDGTILTKDCPVGLAALRRRVSRAASAVAGLIIGLFGGTAATLAFRDAEPTVGDYGGYVAGAIAVPEPPRPDVVGQLIAPPEIEQGKVMGRVQIQPRKRSR